MRDPRRDQAIAQQARRSPSSVQQAIVAAIESRLSVADQLEATLAQSLQQAEALRQSVLKQAFEGRLV